MPDQSGRTLSPDDLRAALIKEWRIRFGEPPFAAHLTLDDLASAVLYVVSAPARVQPP